MDVGVEGAEVVVAEAARDADRGQHARPLALAQNHGIFEILFVGRLERPTLWGVKVEMTWRRLYCSGSISHVNAGFQFTSVFEFLGILVLGKVFSSSS